MVLDGVRVKIPLQDLAAGEVGSCWGWSRGRHIIGKL